MFYGVGILISIFKRKKYGLEYLSNRIEFEYQTFSFAIHTITLHIKSLSIYERHEETLGKRPKLH